MEPHAEAERLDEKLAWYRGAAGYAEMLRLVPPAGVEAPLWAAIAEVDSETELIAVEALPAECLGYAD